MPPFIVYSLGRSRTAWLSAFLTYGEWKCYHEVSQGLRSLQDIQEMFQIPNIGILETAAIQARPLIKYVRPDIREVVILRDVEEAMQSYLKTEIVQWDVEKMRKTLQRAQRELEIAAQDPGVLAINYEDLSTEEGCHRIFEFCLPYKFDPEWWALGKDQNIQADMNKFFQYYFENKDAIQAFKKQLWSDLRRLCKMGKICHQ